MRRQGAYPSSARGYCACGLQACLERVISSKMCRQGLVAWAAVRLRACEKTLADCGNPEAAPHRCTLCSPARRHCVQSDASSETDLTCTHSACCAWMPSLSKE